MLSFQQLLELAIPGLDRKPLPAALTRHPQQPDPDALLSAIAQSTLARKAAKPLLIAHPSASPSIPATPYPHDIPLLPLLNGPFQPALPEFLTALTRAKVPIPPAILPQLLALAQQNHPLKSAILAAAGPVGQWLAAQIPQWNQLYATPDPSRWPIASLPERLAILHFLRSHKPDEALQLLTSTWPLDSAHEKISLLQCLQLNSSKADENFLELCLSEKRKDIRHTAATLLAYIPDSKLSARLQSLATSMVKINPHNHLSISFPEAYTQDGLDLPLHAKSGAKAAFLLDLFARINPDFWSPSPDQVIRLAQQSPWASAILNGLSTATDRFQNARWAEAFLFFLAENDMPEIDTAFVSSIQSPALEMALDQHLILHRGILRENSILYRIMKRSDSPWTEPMTRSFIQHLRSWSAQPNPPYWQMSHYRPLLKSCAYACPVDLLGFIENDWPAQPGYWQHLEKDILLLVQTIAYRKKILAPLSAV